MNLALVASAALAVAAPTSIDPSIRITVDATTPGPAIPVDFAGLSYERNQLLPAADGTRYFRADNTALLTLFRTLGLRSLRVGGNTSDRDAGPPPSDEDLDHLFAFAKAANVKVIYCLQLHNGDPQQNARLVRRILDRHAAQLDYFSIGQEPSAYPVKKIDDRPATERMGAGAEHFLYEDFRDLWRQHHAAIVALSPEARFAGPAVHSQAEWTRRFTEDFGKNHGVVALLGHLYPCGNGKRVTDPAEGRRRMLSGAVYKTYREMNDSMAPFAAASSLPWRMEETNSFWNGGAAGASNTATAALWGLDYLHWWAAQGCAGINFHTGDSVAAGSVLVAPQYAAFVTAPGGYEIRPLGYALAAYALAGPGSPLALTLEGDAADVRAHALLAADGTVSITLIHTGHGTASQPREISLALPPAKSARLALLDIPQGDISTTSGLTLGGAPIAPDGSWAGQWQPVSHDAQGAYRLILPPASAAILRLAPSP